VVVFGCFALSPESGGIQQPVPHPFVFDIFPLHFQSKIEKEKPCGNCGYCFALSPESGGI
jgi:hypothetical protein